MPEPATAIIRPPIPLLQRIGLGLLILLVVVLVAGNRSTFAAGWRAARGADPRWMVVTTLLLVLWFVNLGALHAATQRAAGLSPALRRIVPLAVASNFLNLVVMSAGLAGAAVFVADAKRRGKASGPVLAGYALAALVTEVGFAVVLGAALAVAAVSGRLTSPEIIASVVFAGYLAIRVALMAAAARSRSAVRRLYAGPARWRAWLRRRPHIALEDHRAADDLHEAMALVRRRSSALGPAFVHGILVEVIAMAMLWTVMAAVGAQGGASAPVIAYAVAGLFAIVGFMPAGLGFVELSMAAVFLSFGIPGATAGAAVAIYRLFELWIPVALGAAVARRVRSLEVVGP